MNNNNIFRLVLLFSLILGLGACKTLAPEVQADWPEEKFFQMGQDALDTNNYASALVYYQSYLEYHPENEQKAREARYEIALIHMKQNNKELAKTEFTELVTEMKSSKTGPEWVMTLSEKMLSKIDGTPKE